MAITFRLLSFTLFLVVISLFFYQAGYRLNTGISYPTGVYRLADRTASWQKGDLVLFCPPDNAVMLDALKRGYLNIGICPGGFNPVIKKIMAVAGDTVSFDGLVSINGVTVPHARMLRVDHEGRPLPSLDPIKLTDGQYFMMSDHKPAISFDSRYYGPVLAKNLIDHINPVFTW